MGITTDALSINSAYHKHQLERILRHLRASSVIDVLTPGVWLATSLSNELATSHFQHSILFCHYTTRQAFNGLPEYFSRMAKKDPASVPGPFQIGMQSPLDFFPWLGANPTEASYFNHFMQAYRAGNQMWFESGFYSVEDRLVKGFDSSVTPQPIRSARAYFLHSVLHDWGDSDCLRILANLKPALKPGYSRVLFNEIVLSEENPTIQATSMDMMMLAHCDPAHERTERAWRELLGKAGYVVKGIVRSAGAAESVIEAEIE